jgi:hypothetical protein
MSFFKAPKPPKMPTITPPPPPPTIDAAQEAADADFRRRRRKGRGAYVFAGRTGGAAPTVATKTMVGQ